MKIVTLISAAVLSLSASVAIAQVNNTSVNTDLSYSNVTTELQQLDSPFLREGINIQVSNIHRVRPGLSVAEVSGLLGTPVERKSHEWDYNLNLQLEDGRNLLVCQYKVVFDENGIVTETAWRRQQCKMLADRKQS
ncbi:TPA: outer membrane protein assembly factor BamE [Providencia rettgeri]|nr:outer membrane protein assembly factor BamE [Providencia rettgeri]